MKWNFSKNMGAMVLLIFSLLAQSQLATAAAQTAQHPHNDIIEAASQFAYATHADAIKVDVSIKGLDSRLNLSLCESELFLFWPPGSVKIGRSTIGIHCKDKQTWKIYVRALINVYDYIAVVSEPVNNGDLLSNQNVVLQLKSVSGMRGDRLTNVDRLMGYRFKRRYATGRALTLSMLAPPRLVKKGTKVVIRSGNSNVRVQMKGTALSDGEKGSIINVRNSSSSRIVQGEVVSKGIVQIYQ